jgi:hypothetical protein
LNQRLWLACLGTIVLGAHASSAQANGRFPAANQLVFNPADANHFVVRTTFGFVESTDAGRSFRWICEGMVSPTGVQDPPLALTGDGSLVVAVPFEGVAVSHDHGCSWAYAPAPLAEQFAVDVTLDPRAPSNLLVLTSTGDSSIPAGSEPEFIGLLVETRDDARSWSIFGTPLPRDFIAAAFDVAPSNPDRIYVSGVVAGAQPSAVIERTDDRGGAWTRYALPLPALPTGAFLSAIHPHDPARLWVRVLFAADANGASPTSLYNSNDGGMSWTEVAATPDSMLGFALSPDGETLAYGSLATGVLSGPASGHEFTPIATLSNRCLTWTASALYACGTEPLDPFALGFAPAPPEPFEPLYRLAGTCPQECAETTSFAATCEPPWSDPQGIATATKASGESCSVPWARTNGRAGSAGAPNGGAPAGASGTSTGGDAGVGTGGPLPQGSKADRACGLAHAASNRPVWPCFSLACVALCLRRRSGVRASCHSESGRPKPSAGATCAGRTHRCMHLSLPRQRGSAPRCCSSAPS